MIILKTPSEIEIMYEAGQINYAGHMEVKKHIAPGVTTYELDVIAEKFIRDAGGKPAFKGYVVDGRKYPATLNTSINDEVVHGIPSKKRVLKEGDIISIDLGTVWKGYNADSAYTWSVGKVSDEKKKLMEVTEECLMRAIRKLIPQNRMGDISRTVQEHAEANGFSVVRQLTGHGIGRKLHEEPQIPNYVKPGPSIVLKKGMVFAIEPMINMGVYQVEVLNDHWTIVTADGKPSAHFEHTIAITENGPRILTAPEGSVKL